MSHQVVENEKIGTCVKGDNYCDITFRGAANMGFKTRIGRYLGQPSQQLRMKTVDRTGCRNGLTECLILRSRHLFFHGLY